MTKFGIGIGGALLMGWLALAACGPSLPPDAQSASETLLAAPQTATPQEAAPQTAAPIEPTPIEPTPEDSVPTPETALDAATLPPAAREAQQQLARHLEIEPQSVSVLSVEATDWPDSCLGAEQPGEMCAAVITPGFKIVLDANGQKYVLHTNADGSNYRVVEPTQ